MNSLGSWHYQELIARWDGRKNVWERVCVCQMYLEGGGSAALGLLGGRSHDGHSAGLHCDLILQVKRSQLSWARTDQQVQTDRRKKRGGGRMLGWRVTSCRRTLTTTTGVTADRGGAGWRVGGDNEAVQHRRRKVSAVVSHVSQLIVVFLSEAHAAFWI